MRAIKFRFWKPETKEWVDFPNRGIKSFEPLIAEIYTNSNYFIPEQFTGFLDKNGTEIYEGDILHGATYAIRNATQVVKWDDIEDYEWGERIGVGFRLDTPNPEDWEVIGNVHENPELLK